MEEAVQSPHGAQEERCHGSYGKPIWMKSFETEAPSAVSAGTVTLATRKAAFSDAVDTPGTTTGTSSGRACFLAIH